MAKKSQNHWNEIKAELGKRSNAIDIVKELYELSDQNKYFREARFLDFTINTIEPYKKIIVKALNPDPFKNEPIFIDKAQKAVEDYRKSTNDHNSSMELAFLFLNGVGTSGVMPSRTTGSTRLESESWNSSLPSGEASTTAT